MNKLKIITAALTLMLSGMATATVYEYHNDGGTFGGQGGAYSFNSLFGSYNSATQDFVWEVDYKDQAADGGWLVISDGPNPKGVTNQLAILYFDADTDSVWAYAYNGANSSASYKTTTFLGQYDGAYSTSGTVGTISLNVGLINAILTEGVMFDTSIGIWFHPAFKVSTTTNGDGSLKKFKTKKTVWYDTNNETATEVPAPATLLLLGLGLALMGFRRQ